MFDAAWLDFTGPITEALLVALGQFWPRVRKALWVTSLDARWSRSVSDRVSRYDGVPNLLHRTLPGSVMVDVHRYADTVPMVQAYYERRCP